MSGLLAGGGALLAAAATAAAILLPPGRRRSAAMLLAAALALVLVVGDQWHSRQVVDLRDSAERVALFGAGAAVAVALLAAGFRRWPPALPLAIVAALPFRVPLESGGESANLLVPLYLVIAAGVLATALRDWVGETGGRRLGEPVASAAVAAPPAVAAATGPAGRAVRWLPRILATAIFLYAVQTLYSADFSKGLQNLCFFFVPFALAYALLREVSWDRRLLTLALWVVAIEAVAFVIVGSIEYASRGLFWNDQVIRSNEFHTYFRVNSVFWDPNIYGRYLALAIVLATAALLWARERRAVAALSALVAILWLGLVPTFSQSSFAALLAGLAVLAAIRWSLRWTLAAVCAGAVITVLFMTLNGSVDFSRINIDTSGRANLVSGGARLFGQRPVWGYGSGAFPAAYKKHVASANAPVSVSHTEPVTVAAEQGTAGVLVYLALMVAALWTLGRGVLRQPVPPAGGARGAAALLAPGRAAVLAAFVALLAHTMAYAGFFEDPIAWVLLAVGGSLATATPREARMPGRRSAAPPRLSRRP